MAKKRPHGFTEEYIHQKTREEFDNLDYQKILDVTKKYEVEGTGGQIGNAIHLFLKGLEKSFDVTENESAHMLIGCACAVLAAAKAKQNMASNN